MSARARAALLAAALALAGCHAQPMAFPDSPAELGTRPGLLTGPEGSFTLCCHADPVPKRGDASE